MHAGAGILTSRGGMTSHAAVVARGMGKPCVVGAERARIDDRGGRVAGRRARRSSEGDDDHRSTARRRGDPGRRCRCVRAAESTRTSTATLDGLGRRGAAAARARQRRHARRRRKARELGAEGIGLCRTEHMFFGEERLAAVREMILAADEERRRAALDRLLPMQQRGLRGHLRAMDGLPVTIRLLDPPLHEFLPTSDEAGSSALARRPRRRSRQSGSRRASRRCTRPTRCWAPGAAGWASQYPEIYEMQVRGDRPARPGRWRPRRRDHAPAGRLRRGAAPAAVADRDRDRAGGRAAPRASWSEQ